MFGVEFKNDEQVLALRSPPLTDAVRAWFAARYDLIIFDELQDADPTRFLMMHCLISATAARVILVGDRCLIPASDT